MATATPRIAALATAHGLWVLSISTRPRPYSRRHRDTKTRKTNSYLSSCLGVFVSSCCNRRYVSLAGARGGAGLLRPLDSKHPPEEGQRLNPVRRVVRAGIDA